LDAVVFGALTKKSAVIDHIAYWRQAADGGAAGDGLDIERAALDGGIAAIRAEPIEEQGGWAAMVMPIGRPAGDSRDS